MKPQTTKHKNKINKEIIELLDNMLWSIKLQRMTLENNKKKIQKLRKLNLEIERLL